MEVSIFPPNAINLYDMYRNDWEWCADHWHENYHGAADPGLAYRETAVLQYASNFSPATVAIKLGFLMSASPEFNRLALTFSDTQGSCLLVLGR